MVRSASGKLLEYGGYESYIPKEKVRICKKSHAEEQDKGRITTEN